MNTLPPTKVVKLRTEFLSDSANNCFVLAIVLKRKHLCCTIYSCSVNRLAHLDYGYLQLLQLSLAYYALGLLLLPLNLAWLQCWSLMFVSCSGQSVLKTMNKNLSTSQLHATLCRSNINSQNHWLLFTLNLMVGTLQNSESSMSLNLRVFPDSSWYQLCRSFYSDT